jgi:predicted DNA-binding transcriptional regulator AlpA
MEVYRDPQGEKPSPAEVATATFSAWEAAEFIGCSERKLWGLRKAGQGPKFIRIGRAIRYPRHLVLAWMDAVAEGGAT